MHIALRTRSIRCSDVCIARNQYPRVLKPGNDQRATGTVFIDGMFTEMLDKLGAITSRGVKSMRPKSYQHKGVNRFLRSRSVALIVSFSVVSLFIFCATTSLAHFSAFCVDGGEVCSPTGKEKDVTHEHHDHGDAEQSHHSHTDSSQPTSPKVPKESASDLCCSSLVAVRTNVSSGYQPSQQPVVIQLVQTARREPLHTGNLEGNAHAPPESFSESDRLHELFGFVRLSHAPPLS